MQLEKRHYNSISTTAKPLCTSPTYMDPHVRPSIFVSSSIAPGPIHQHLDQDQGTTLHREWRLLAYGVPTPPSPPTGGAASHLPAPPPTRASPWPLQRMHVTALSAPPPAPRHVRPAARGTAWPHRRRLAVPSAAPLGRHVRPDAHGPACQRRCRLAVPTAQRRRPPADACAYVKIMLMYMYLL